MSKIKWVYCDDQMPVPGQTVLLKYYWSTYKTPIKLFVTKGEKKSFHNAEFDNGGCWFVVAKYLGCGKFSSESRWGTIPHQHIFTEYPPHGTRVNKGYKVKVKIEPYQWMRLPK